MNEEDKPLEVGHVVKTKAGGPEMVVVSVEGDDMVRCVWWKDPDFGEIKLPRKALMRTRGLG